MDSIIEEVKNAIIHRLINFVNTITFFVDIADAVAFSRFVIHRICHYVMNIIINVVPYIR